MRRNPSLPSMTPPYSQSPAMTPSNSQGGYAPQPTYASGPLTSQNMPPGLYQQYIYHAQYPPSPNMNMGTTFHSQP